MMTNEQRQKNRGLLIDGIRAATTPEKTGRFSFDGFKFLEDGVLELSGDHGTPDYSIRFERGCMVTVERTDNRMRFIKEQIPYSNYTVLSNRVVELMMRLMY